MLSSSLRLALYCTVQNLQNPSLYLEQNKVSHIKFNDDNNDNDDDDDDDDDDDENVWFHQISTPTQKVIRNSKGVVLILKSIFLKQSIKLN